MLWNSFLIGSDRRASAGRLPPAGRARSSPAPSSCWRRGTTCRARSAVRLLPSSVRDRDGDFARRSNAMSSWTRAFKSGARTLMRQDSSREQQPGHSGPSVILKDVSARSGRIERHRRGRRAGGPVGGAGARGARRRRDGRRGARARRRAGVDDARRSSPRGQHAEAGRRSHRRGAGARARRSRASSA